MKKILFLFGCIAALNLASCVSSSNEEDESLSNADIAACFNAVRGDYSVKIVFNAKNSSNIYDNQDTLDINWSFTADSTLIIRSFPAKILAESISNTSVKNALLEQDPKRDLNCLIAFYQLSPYVQFLIGPKKLDYYILINDETHTLSMYCWANNYSFGAKNSSDDTMFLRLEIAAAYLDGNESLNLLSSYNSSELVQIPILIATTLAEG